MENNEQVLKTIIEKARIAQAKISHYTQAQIDEVRREFEADIQEVDKKIGKATESVKIELRELKQRSNTLENRINEVSVGGLKTQVFGVSLMIYGAIAGFIA